MNSSFSYLAVNSQGKLSDGHRIPRRDQPMTTTLPAPRPPRVGTCCHTDPPLNAIPAPRTRNQKSRQSMTCHNHATSHDLNALAAASLDTENSAPSTRTTPTAHTSPQLRKTRSPSCARYRVACNPAAYRPTFPLGGWPAVSARSTSAAPPGLDLQLAGTLETTQSLVPLANQRLTRQLPPHRLSPPQRPRCARRWYLLAIDDCVCHLIRQRVSRQQNGVTVSGGILVSYALNIQFGFN